MTVQELIKSLQALKSPKSEVMIIDAETAWYLAIQEVITQKEFKNIVFIRGHYNHPDNIE